MLISVHSALSIAIHVDTRIICLANLRTESQKPDLLGKSLVEPLSIEDEERTWDGKFVTVSGGTHDFDCLIFE